jgi:hypothetical protein
MIDNAAFREIAKGPGADTRQWVSMGTVEIGTADQHPVRFNDETGAPLPHGVLVDVKLRPSGIVVPCRVASDCAGNGEGEYHPFVDGDEVLVAIPGGDERAGCVILKRCNQAMDAFPRTVAGMDATANTLAFKRVRAPYAIESAAAIVLRVASTGSTLALDPTGQVFLSSGDGALLAMAHDACSFQLKDLSAGFQLDPSKKQASIIAGSTSVVVDNDASEWQTAGVLKVSTAGNGAAEHVTTIEAVSNLMTALGLAIAALGPAPPLTGLSLGAVFAAGWPAILAAAAKLPLSATNATAIITGLKTPKSPGTPSLGCPGFLAS